MNAAMMMPAANRIERLTLAGGLEDRPQLAAQALRVRLASTAGLQSPDATPRARRWKMLSTMITVPIDDQPEIDGADAQEVGGFPAQHHDADGEEQREGNGRAHDHGAAQIAEEHPLQQEYRARCRTPYCAARSWW